MNNFPHSGPDAVSITAEHLTEFLRKLQASDVLPSDWERRFLESFGHGNHTGWFTEGRRKSTEAMWRKYGAMINHPFPGDCVTATNLPKANADGCEYIVKLDGVQQCCNEPAAWENRRRFRYCEMHREVVLKELRRRGGVMELRKFVP